MPQARRNTSRAAMAWPARACQAIQAPPARPVAMAAVTRPTRAQWKTRSGKSQTGTSAGASASACGRANSGLASCCDIGAPAGRLRARLRRLDVDDGLATLVLVVLAAGGADDLVALLGQQVARHAGAHGVVGHG